MTPARVVEWIAEGRGTGVGDAYLPWIQITKSNTSSRSNQSVARLTGLARPCHFLSRGERHLSQVLLWLGVEDVREQFPLWGWDHPHPMEEVAPDGAWDPMPGMEEIAKEAGIDVFRYPGTKIPAVLTTDLLVTLPTRDGTKRLAGISCKPESEYTKETGEHVRERLELDRRYMACAKLPHLLAHPEQLPRDFIRQLDWLAPLVPFSAIRQFASCASYQKFAERLSSTAFDRPLGIAAVEASHGLEWSVEFAQGAARFALWRLDVDANLLKPIAMWEPVPQGGRSIRNQIRANLFGNNAWT